MKILYGVCGEGLGHAYRALAIVEHLKKKGHKVLILTYGKAYDVLKEKFMVIEVPGLNYVIKESRIMKTRTFIHNVRNFPKNFIKNNGFRKLISDFKPDIYLTDFEPISAYLAKIHWKPLISIDNEHMITSLNISVPAKEKANYLLAKNIVRAMTGRARYFIVASFFNYTPNRRKIIVVPPILRPDIFSWKVENGNKIVVYLSREDDTIISKLKEIKEKFVVFGYNTNRKKGNIEFKTREKFLREMVKCRAIISTAGFTSISEAIYLKKPFFALPIKGQFEQRLNAHLLAQSGFGRYSENLGKGDIENFLNQLGDYEKNLKEYNPDYNKVFDILDGLLKKITKWTHRESNSGFKTASLVFYH